MAASASRAWWSPQSGRELLTQQGGASIEGQRNKQNRQEALGHGVGAVRATTEDRLPSDNDNDTPNTSEALQELNVNNEPDCLLKELDSIIDATKNLEGDISELQYTIRNSLYSSIAAGVIDNEDINVTWTGAWCNTTNKKENTNFAFSSQRRKWRFSNSVEEKSKRINTISQSSSNSINSYNDENALPPYTNEQLDTNSRSSRRNIDLDLHNAAKVNDTWKSSSSIPNGMVTEKKNHARMKSRNNDSYIDIDDVLNNM